MLAVSINQIASCNFHQAPPSLGVVGTNSPLILLMPELGLLYILSSSDPLCKKEKKDRQDGQGNHFYSPGGPSKTPVKQWSLRTQKVPLKEEYSGKWKGPK